MPKNLDELIFQLENNRYADTNIMQALRDAVAYITDNTEWVFSKPTNQTFFMSEGAWSALLRHLQSMGYSEVEISVVFGILKACLTPQIRECVLHLQKTLLIKKVLDDGGIIP